MSDYSDPAYSPNVPVSDRPNDLACKTTVDITESVSNMRLLPDSVYDRRCRPMTVSEITPEMIEEFLTELETTGQYALAASKVGLYERILKKIEKMDQRFATMVADSLALYTGKVETELHRRAVEGWDEPVFSHKTGAMLGTIRRHDARLLELLVKKLNPAYREKIEATTSVNVGVMVVPMAPVSEDAWREAAAQASRPIESTVINPPALPAADENSPPDLTGS